ncbi:MAG: ferritin-like domain-containing protein [Ferruginibacter sp.]|nr:ferritin-like domain-containing protein [Ferruginibacter sp.]
MKRQLSPPPLQDEKLISSFGIQRRNMLKFFGASAAVVALGTACNNDDDVDQNTDTGVFLGAGDFQILNFAYALEQLEAAFYVQVLASPGFTAMSALEKEYMTDIKDHEVIHREYFKAALGSNAIKGLTPNFGAVDFNTRAGILAQAKAFEDTGVAAYNGAGQYLVDLNYLTAAGKIVSVEARHAALIRDLISNGTFSDDLDANALEISKPPSAIIDIANAFLAADSKISKRGIPA